MGPLSRGAITVVISALLEFVQQVSRARGKPLPHSGAMVERGGPAQPRSGRIGLEPLPLREGPEPRPPRRAQWRPPRSPRCRRR